VDAGPGRAPLRRRPGLELPGAGDDAEQALRGAAGGGGGGGGSEPGSLTRPNLHKGHRTARRPACSGQAQPRSCSRWSSIPAAWASSWTTVT
jgi:hypothetical protein